MTPEEKELLAELMVMIGTFELRCRHAQAPISPPPAIFETLGRLRDQTGGWITECMMLKAPEAGKDTK